jgi:2,3-bisphosphoglycerate-dependent phosphoglycerate mutase
VATAVLIADKVEIIEELHERTSGEAKEDFWLKQYRDYDFSNPNGETLNEVKVRMKNAMDYIVKSLSDGDKALVVSHATAICAYLLNFGTVKVIDVSQKSREITYKNKVIMRGNINPIDYFVMEYKDDMVTNIIFCKGVPD